MRMQVILDSLFARPGSAPIGGGKKGEFRDWTNFDPDVCNISRSRKAPYTIELKLVLRRYAVVLHHRTERH